MDDNTRSRPSRVLRATDVIPPFDKDVSPANEPQEPVPAQTRPQPPKSERRVRHVQEPKSNDGNVSLTEQPPMAPEIPAFDLAENILAEHRRTAARRRKAPGQVQAEPEVQSARPVVKTHVVEPPSQDLLDLHRVVAEIVARDIEQLCKNPARSPYG
jgi:hypothetical protein